jgi:CelD/BcsL family acetyltransferase involved in cellulose biosynthesis
VKVVDRAVFEGLEAEWNGLLETTSDEAFYRHEQVRSHLDNFRQTSAVATLIARDQSGQLVAALPLVRERSFFYGIPIRQLSSPTNIHSIRFDLIARDADSAAAAFLDTLAASPWDVLKMTEVPEGGKAWRIHDAARQAGYPVHSWESHRSPYVVLPRSFEALQKTLRSKFVANLRRRRRRLEERGRVTVERYAGAALLPAHFEECLAIERSGWKGRGGTAVSQREQTYGFHVQRAASAFHRNHLSVFFLKLDGRPIAFHHGLTFRGVYSLLMTGYDEGFADCSPGHLLLEDLLKDCIDRNLHELDFLGCDLPWKLEWTALVRRHHWLFIFRDTALGRTLCRAKLDWAPAARRLARRWGLK